MKFDFVDVSFNKFMTLTGLLTLEKCKKHFHTVPGPFLHLKKLMESMYASLVCTFKNMEVNAKALTLEESILHT